MENSTLQAQSIPAYVLGLDIGIASIGWACVAVDEKEQPYGLLDCGVRIFDAAENPKDGSSLNATRREKRALRRSIHRRALRMQRGKALCKKFGLLEASDFINKNEVTGLPNDTWELRVAGLTRQLNRKEWAAVLLHLLKHRGYLSQRKSEATTTDKELGKLLSGVAQNHQMLDEKAYQSCAELALNEFKGKWRNHSGDYSHTFNRLDLLAEIHTLFAKQRAFGNSFTDTEFEDTFCDLFMWQKPALSGDALLNMVGKCTFEKGEYRAAKHSYTAERFIMLGKLLNLRFSDNGGQRGLTQEECQQLLELAYKQTKVTYTQVKKALNLPEDTLFKGLPYGRAKTAEEIKKVEGRTFLEAKAYHQIRKAVEKVDKQAWELMKADAKLLDHIGTTFSLYKTDEDFTKQLEHVDLASEIKDSLMMELNFDKFINLSLKALYQILPYMEQGKRYDEACAAIYGDHYGKKLGQISTLLPPLNEEQKYQLTNPVVIRALSQARKVINAIIRKYGSPARVHIETGRDVGKSYKARRDIEKQQEKNRKERELAVKDFSENFPEFGGVPKGKDILKMRLYKAQDGKCLYSGKPLDLRRLNEKGYVEVDHALPFSRTWDDSMNNKVLVLAGENQNKGNKTPYEWLGHTDRWQDFVARVLNSHFSPMKKERILTKVLDEKGFIERNLNDTRYISKFLSQWIDDNLQLTGQGKRRVLMTNGQITSLLRARWGLHKVREENDRHHAMDAVVIACTTPSMQKRISDYSKRREMQLFGERKGKMIDESTGEISYIHFPTPWEYFYQDVNARVFSDNPQNTLQENVPDRAEILADFVTPLFVSRMPNRKVTGQGHLETIRGAKNYLTDKVSTIRKPLTSLKLKDLENMINKEREPVLYEALKARLTEFNDDGAKAFAEPFYKKGGQQVKSIKLQDKQNTGVLLNDGKAIADNGDMVRTDVFIKKGKYFLVPVYAWQVEKGILPMKACIAKKTEDEWEDMDETAEFQFSMYKNDLIEVLRKNKPTIIGYFNKLNRSSGCIDLILHDRDTSQIKDGIIESLGIKGAIAVKKLDVDILGKTISPCKKEKRSDFR
ncbi:type II CRISPR RNA-guided endonuclease Cas9 [Actinobacillus delphinicola]|uniref:CRISPR-associated endonuclease Cas9 n=1 Tax=Actinobacillus delphinicola TaxID=51161 RepID=A0A448TRY8_9PAST|nr:type II CRISPR RNA-guided endonuclease Cas9 [Actinobacillus delphinicola]VEJ08750.1 CRISPR-associated endonuclease Csn1 family protein [Actinobacillus delphinicola]